MDYLRDFSNKVKNKLSEQDQSTLKYEQKKNEWVKLQIENQNLYHDWKNMMLDQEPERWSDINSSNRSSLPFEEYGYLPFHEHLRLGYEIYDRDIKDFKKYLKEQNTNSNG